jgi:hypothetical protein
MRDVAARFLQYFEVGSSVAIRGGISHMTTISVCGSVYEAQLGAFTVRSAEASLTFDLREACLSLSNEGKDEFWEIRFRVAEGDMFTFHKL